MNSVTLMSYNGGGALNSLIKALSSSQHKAPDTRYMLPTDENAERHHERYTSLQVIPQQDNSFLVT